MRLMQEIEVVPSLLSADFANLAREIKKVERAGCRRIHYLGRETVQNIIFFRFGNSIFEPLWNRRYIDHIQISVAEDIGIEHRGIFYEQAGVVRDIVQNHLMQLIALTAMEPPIGFEADLIRDEKVKVFKTGKIIQQRIFRIILRVVGVPQRQRT